MGKSTPVRFYGWHIAGLMIALFALLVWHIWRIRRDGGISYAERRPRVDRSALVHMEGLATVIVLGLLGLTSLLWDAPLAPPADLNAPAAGESSAPWFFLGVQELLRWTRPLLGGVIAPLVSLVLVAVIPYALDRGDAGEGTWFNRPGRRAQLVFGGVLVIAIAITLRGTLR